MFRRIALVTALTTLGLVLVALTFIPPRATAQMDSTSGFVVDQTYDAVWGNVSPGDRIETTYFVLNGNRVAPEIQLPAPEVGVSKWNTSGYARPGGVYVYGISYGNKGSGVASDTLIVDTLPQYTTWAGDTSGFTPEIGAGGVITWHLGDVTPGGEIPFMVTLDVSAAAPTGTAVIASNCATISTTAPGDYDPKNDSSCSGPVDVWEEDLNVNVAKWPSPGDPAPGQEFEYGIRWCAGQGVAAGPVWLTDTLPLSTTFVSWSPQNWREIYWSVVITTGGQLVLYAPGLPGHMCENLTLRLLLDDEAQVGTTLRNTVVITTPSDPAFDNENVNTDARVSPPRYDIRADKWFGNGVLVPGGWIGYGISAWNQGNSAVHIWITDTLPSGTSYQLGSAREVNGGPAFPPALVTDEYVVWDLGVIGVNQGFGLDFTADVSDTVAPGTVLTNCATVGITATEDTPWNNIAFVAQTINTLGPNLRVTKQSWWNGDGQLGYKVQFYNVGNQTISNVWITDTLPDSTTWDGSWKLGFDKNRITSQNLDSQVLGVEFSELYPGDSGGIDFNANLDDPNARPRWYTNTVKIVPLAGDIYPPDNTYADVAAKGEVDRAELWMNTTGNSNMWGQAVPGTVTLTTVYTRVTAFADPACGGCWPNGGPNPDVGPVHPGDTITVTAGAGRLPIVIHVPNPFTAQADSRTDKVWGQIGGGNNQTVEVHGQWPNGSPLGNPGDLNALDEQGR